MEHRKIGNNARTLLAAFLVGALLAAPAAGESQLQEHKLKGKQEKYAEITFYFNLTLGVSTFFVLPPVGGFPAQPPATFTFFGAAEVFDTPITSGLESESSPLGSAKGIFVFDNNNNVTGPGIEFLATAVFNDASGFGAGSTISFQGYSELALPVRELSITGGTGKFRLARGWVEVSTPASEGVTAILLFVSHVFYYDLE